MKAEELRIVYMGTPDFAVEPLRKLVETGHNVVGVVTAPDRPAGRGLKMKASPVKEYAQAAGLPVLQPEKLRDPEFLRQLAKLDADLGIVIAFRMLPEVVWSMPRLGTFNLHASLLPAYRGAAPINRAIMNGETRTGVTTFFLNSQIDEGDMLVQREVAIGADETAGELHDKLMYLGAEVVLQTVAGIVSGTLIPVPQTLTDTPTPAAPKIFSEDCRIDWKLPAVTIHDHIRGLSPYPGAWTTLSPEETNPQTQPVTVKILKAKTSNKPSSLPGTFAGGNSGILTVGTGEGALEIIELQPAGKKRMSVADFLRGFRDIERYRFV